MVKRSATVAGAKRKEFANKISKVVQAKKSGKKGSAVSHSKSSANPNRPDPSGGKAGSQFRDRATINRLNMYKKKPNYENMKKRPTDPHAGRIEPDRKWFGNVRTADQKELDRYRKALEANTEKTGSGFSVHIKSKKLPLSLVKDTLTKTLSEGERLLQVQSFESTFGGKAQRKRPNISGTIASMTDLVDQVEKAHDNYDPTKDTDITKQIVLDAKDETRHAIFEKGLSRRIWEELYKVIDSSDVIINVLDARNPLGTRTNTLEEHIKRNCASKHFIFVLNKCDLVPTSVTQKWVRYLQQSYPCVAFQASHQNPFGKGSLIQLLKQFDCLHRNKKSISVGFVGYPNVGKSSIINALMKKDCCRVAPIPGETKVWQYITMTKRIFLIDCPGIVYDTNESETDKVLKGVVRAEKLPAPEQYIQAILDKVQTKHITDIFGVNHWADSEDFLQQVA